MKPFKKSLVYFGLACAVMIGLGGCDGGGGESQNTSYQWAQVTGDLHPSGPWHLSIQMGAARVHPLGGSTEVIYIAGSGYQYGITFDSNDGNYAVQLDGGSKVATSGTGYQSGQVGTPNAMEYHAIHVYQASQVWVEGTEHGDHGGGGSWTTVYNQIASYPYAIYEDTQGPSIQMVSQPTFIDASTGTMEYITSGRSDYSLDFGCAPNPAELGMAGISFSVSTIDGKIVSGQTGGTATISYAGTDQVVPARGSGGAGTRLIAVDNLGDSAAAGPFEVVFDATPPTVTIPSTVYVAAGSTIKISPTVTSSASGIQSIVISAQDGSGTAVAVAPTPRSISATSYAKPIDITSLVSTGTSVSLTVTATSNAGLSASAPVTVNILQDVSKSAVSLGPVAYGTSGTQSGYIAALGIPANTLATDGSEELKIVRTIGSGSSAVTGFGGSPSPSVGSYASDSSWEIPVDGTLGQQGGSYVVTDIIPAGSEYAHKQVSYTVSVIQSGDSTLVGTYQGPTARAIADTPPDLKFAVVDGNGSTVATLSGAGGSATTLYCNGIVGDARSAGAMKIQYIGSGDVDGDSVAWSLSDGASAVQLADGMTLGQILSQYPTTSSGKKTATDSFGIGYTESAASLASPTTGPRAGSYAIVLDEGAPWVTSLGRQVTTSKGTTALVNYTTNPDFGLTLNAQDAETGVQSIRLYVSSETIGKSTQTFSEPTTTVTKNVSVTSGVPDASSLALSPAEQTALQAGGELVVSLSAPVSPLSLTLPWSLPQNQDGNYSFTAIVKDAAGNSAKPVCDIVLDRSQAASQGAWELDLDPNAIAVVSLPRDLGAAATPPDQAVVTVSSYIVGATGSIAVSGAATVHGTGTEVSGVSVTQVSSDSGSASASNGAYSLSFLTNPGMYESYDVTISAQDGSGGTESATTTIRVNRPAVIAMPAEIDTTSHKPLALALGMAGDGTSGNLGTLSDDGPDGPYTVVWTVTDSGTGAAATPLSYTYTPGSASNAPPSYSFPGASGSQYTLAAQVTDSWGATSTASSTVVVRNTTKGQLYADETWTGTQSLEGVVEVPSGITLTIDSTCRLSAVGVPENPTISDCELFGVHVDSGGTLLVQDGAALGAGPWGGLRIAGTCAIAGGASGVLISGAVQAVAVDVSGSATIAGTTFLGNLVGVQSLSPNVNIQSCTFSENTGYAIKEESGGQPKVLNCTFVSNAYAYYQASTGTVIDATGLNGLGSNSGNK